MASLADLALRTSYHKGRDDIAEQFYLPCMMRATEYDRAVGFFRSAAFIIAWPALRDFVARNGVMRVLCSQVLSDEDVEAISQGYEARIDAVLAKRLVEEVRELLSDDVLAAPARVLAALIANNTLDMKIAVMKRADLTTAHGRIFHDKLGIFRDRDRNVVIFKGSMNETWSGLSADGNLESVDVAASWMGARDLERAQTEGRYFTDLWNDDYPTLSVRPFPEVAREELRVAADKDWERSLDTLLKNKGRPSDSRGRTLRPHQSAGLAAWRANEHRGILAFATGSGKTFTAITAIREVIKHHQMPVLVVVPDQVLFNQWFIELEETTKDLSCRILRAGAGYDHWREGLALWTAPDSSPRITLATVQTASSPDFLQRLMGGQHLMLVADEVHRLGSVHHRRLLDESLFGFRLGLSATPERAGDDFGTDALISFFRGILEPRYGLADAIRDQVLCEYFYRPHTVHLAEHEAEEWVAITKELVQVHSVNAKKPDPGLDSRIQRLLIRRARIVKHAEAKIPLAIDVISNNSARDQRWIIYCEDLAQLETISRELLDRGIRNIPFHSQMEGDRREALRWIESRGGILVAIRCLDEGVDIPSVSHALILASSKNQREFVQRRGRVLRKAPNKPLAYIHDAIVLPPEKLSGDTEDKRADPITIGELARAVEFAQYASNPAAAADLQLIALQLGLDWRSLITEGTEDEED